MRRAMREESSCNYEMQLRELLKQEWSREVFEKREHLTKKGMITSSDIKQVQGLIEKVLLNTSSSTEEHHVALNTLEGHLEALNHWERDPHGVHPVLNDVWHQLNILLS